MLVSLICILIGPQKIYPVSVVMDDNKRSSLKKAKLMQNCGERGGGGG